MKKSVRLHGDLDININYSNSDTVLYIGKGGVKENSASRSEIVLLFHPSTKVKVLERLGLSFRIRTSLQKMQNCSNPDWG